MFPLTICFFSAQYLPTVGGVERYTFNLAKRMISAGHHAIVVTSALPGLSRHETDENGIEIFRLPVFPFMNGRFPMPKPGREFSVLCRELWAQNIDFCVIQTRFYPASVYAACAAKKHCVKSIVIDHSTGHMPMGQPLLNFIGGIYEHLVCQIIRYSGADFYGVSQAVCHWLSHFGVDAKGTLYNSVEPKELEKTLDTAREKDWRQTLGLSPETQIIAFVGRIIPEKGVAQLVQAFQILKKENRNPLVLLVAGTGPQLPSLKAACPAGVYYLESVPYPETLQLLHQATVYCLPTVYAEGFPTTLLEAAACRCPIVCTDTAGSNELLPDDSFGLRLPNASPETLAAGLRHALNTPDWCNTAATQTYENLTQHFTWEVTAATLLQLAKGEPECQNS